MLKEFSNSNATQSEGCVYDDENQTLFISDTNEGFVILSSQGNSTLNIYNRRYPYNFINSFNIVGNGSIDAVTDTDGVDVVNNNLGPLFPKGMLVVQDGSNDGEGSIRKQNFKFVSIKDVLDKIDE